MTRVTHDRVLALIAAYGGDPARWPEAEREAAVALMSGDPALAHAAEDARTLDLTLDTLATPHPDPALRVALKEIPERGIGLMDLITGWVGVWRPAAGLAAAAVLGIVIGVANPGLPVPGLETAIVAQDGGDTETDSYSLAAATAAGIVTTDSF